MEATDSWAYDIDIGNVNAVIFLDHKKAFRTQKCTVNCSFLEFCTLKCCIPQGTIFIDIGNVNAVIFLDHKKAFRTQKCTVNCSFLEFCTLKCCIPQGTILGPLLFLLYINDLPNCLSHSEPRMYADDTHLTYSNGNIHSIQSSLNEDLLNINGWLTANKLTLKMTKTEFMLIGSRQKLNNLPSLPFLNINNVPIKHSQCSKSLGLLIDENLT